MEKYKVIERSKDSGSTHSLLVKGMVPGIVYGKGTEPTKIAFEIKENLIGDPNFNDLDVDSLLEKNFISELVNKISINESYTLKNFSITAHPETIYLTVVDKDLNTVSIINSICFPSLRSPN